MAIQYADRVKETTSTAGTGAVTLGGAVNPTFQTFADAGLDGVDIPYAILDLGNDGWEIGLGQRSGSLFIRTTIYDSSVGGGSPINLSGNAEIWNTIPAKLADGIPKGTAEGNIQYKDADNEFGSTSGLRWETAGSPDGLEVVGYISLIGNFRMQGEAAPTAGGNSVFVFGDNLTDPTLAGVSAGIWRNGNDLSFEDATGGPYRLSDLYNPVGGIDGQVQFNNAGTFGGTSELFWDNSGKLLIVTGEVTATKGLIAGQANAGIDYEAIILGTAQEAGGLINFSRSGAGESPFTGLGGYDDGATSRVINIGGGNWGYPDATDFSLSLAATYDETIDSALARWIVHRTGDIETRHLTGSAYRIEMIAGQIQNSPLLQLEDQANNVWANLSNVNDQNPQLFLKDFSQVNKPEFNLRVDGQNSYVDYEIKTAVTGRFINDTVTVMTMFSDNVSLLVPTFFGQNAFDPTVPANTGAIWNDADNDLQFEDKKLGKKSLTELYYGAGTTLNG